MPIPSADSLGGYSRLGPRQPVGLWAMLRAEWSWKEVFRDSGFIYSINKLTGDRRARPRNGFIDRGHPDFKWLDAVE